MLIGFIGLGHMGNPMVRNLLRCNYQVKVFDVVPAAMQDLVTAGATAVNSISDCVRDADVVITMLQSGDQVQASCLGDNGIFSGINKNALYIDCSSIDILVTRKLHQKAEKMSLAMVDAPVSGGVKGAEAGSLTFMVGGAEKNFKQAKPVLECLGRRVIHAGPPCSGQAAKICNNMILGISMIAVSEAFVLGEKLGLDPKIFFDIASHASGQCWSMTSYCPVPGIIDNVPSNNNYQPGFTAAMMLKDLNLSQSAAEAVQAFTPLGQHATELYKKYVKTSNGQLDFSGIIKMIEDYHS